MCCPRSWSCFHSKGQLFCDPFSIDAISKRPDNRLQCSLNLSYIGDICVGCISLNPTTYNVDIILLDKYDKWDLLIFLKNIYLSLPDCQEFQAIRIHFLIFHSSSSRANHRLVTYWSCYFLSPFSWDSKICFSPYPELFPTVIAGSPPQFSPSYVSHTIFHENKCLLANNPLQLICRLILTPPKIQLFFCD